jgi:hypothetical protein
MRWEDPPGVAKYGARQAGGSSEMAFNFEDQEERRPKRAVDWESCKQAFIHGKPDSPYELALSQSWIAKGVLKFKLNGKPRENIRKLPGFAGSGVAESHYREVKGAPLTVHS